ncbi:alpha/beta fold hydrolase [Myxococcus sp. MxC21-1]|nr:alpha/beta fold hydrolase [Myxococcus sp. MxC21-1]WNZ62197.1 alpha/beta fold hydrolase [Myxococcus sp. MxC21-1]
MLDHAEALLPGRFALLGSSYGSLLAMAYALAHPERVKALVLVSPVASVHRIRRLALTLSTLVRAPGPWRTCWRPPWPGCWEASGCRRRAGPKSCARPGACPRWSCCAGCGTSWPRT